MGEKRIKSHETPAAKAAAFNSPTRQCRGEIMKWERIPKGWHGFSPTLAEAPFSGEAKVKPPAIRR